jgi:hypothetical protein
MQWGIRVCLKHLLESLHNRKPKSHRMRAILGVGIGQARDHCVCKRLLQRFGHLRMPQYIRRCRGQVCGRLMQIKQPGHQGRRRPQEAHHSRRP